MIIRGLKLMARLLQAAWFFQGELESRTEKLCQVEESSAMLTAETQAGNFMKAHKRHRMTGGLRRKGERGHYTNNTTTTAQTKGKAILKWRVLLNSHMSRKYGTASFRSSAVALSSY